jgi:hypothetical protein
MYKTVAHEQIIQTPVAKKFQTMTLPKNSAQTEGHIIVTLFFDTVVSRRP